jgi:hypothetical protein
MYGKVDQIPGIAYIATEFFHLQGFPIFPLCSYLFVEETETANKWRSRGASISKSKWAVEDRVKLPVGVPIPFDRKSMWYGYGRAILWLLLGISIIPAILVFVFVDMPPERRFVTIAVVDLIPIVTGIALWASYRLTIATAERKDSILSFLEVSPDVQAHSVNPFFPSLFREVMKVVFGICILALICLVIATLMFILSPHG